MTYGDPLLLFPFSTHVPGLFFLKPVTSRVLKGQHSPRVEELSDQVSMFSPTPPTKPSHGVLFLRSSLNTERVLPARVMNFVHL